MKKTTEFQKIDELIKRVNTINLIERIFAWGEVKNLSLDAAKELGSIDRITESEVQEATQKLEQENIKLEAKINELNNKDKENIKTITGYESKKEIEHQTYTQRIDDLNNAMSQIEKDRLRIQKEKENEIEEKNKQMKETWKVHEKDIEEYLKKICKKQGIAYFDKEKVPIKGKPDNTIEIAGQYIIFDAKSPQGDNFDNFPQYIKTQAETLKKYAKEENVKKDMYFVIPDNTITCIKEHTLNLADYDVYIIPKSSLEPIILSLRKIEDYEFAEKLSPEDRDTIARIIGKFAHTTKRRMQVDSFFFDEYLNILTNCNSLPEEIKVQAIKSESADKLNPPMEKRAKQIPEKELKEDFIVKKQIAKAKKINTDVKLSIEEK